MFTLERSADPFTTFATSLAGSGLQKLNERAAKAKDQKENELIQGSFAKLNEDSTPFEQLSTLMSLDISPDKKKLLLEGFKNLNTASAQLSKGQQQQQTLQEKQTLQQQQALQKQEQAKLVAKRLGISESDIQGLDAKQVLDLYKAEKSGLAKPSITERPIDPEQLDLIEKVRQQPGFQDLDELEQYQAFTRAGVSRANAEAESKLKGQQLERLGKGVETAYKRHENFINDTTSSYRAFETEMKPRLLQMQKLASDDQLIGPTSSVFLESLGIPLGALENPSSELYQKLSQDLLKGLPETYGSRILKVEVDNFLKTIPTLLNSPQGRRMIASNMLKLAEMKEVYYNQMRNLQRKSLDENKPLPMDFQQRIFDDVKPQIDRINEEFVKMADVEDVPKNHVPFFSPTGEIQFVPQEHVQWAIENGGKRIW